MVARNVFLSGWFCTVPEWLSSFAPPTRARRKPFETERRAGPNKHFPSMTIFLSILSCYASWPNLWQDTGCRPRQSFLVGQVPSSDQSFLVGDSTFGVEYRSGSVVRYDPRLIRLIPQSVVVRLYVFCEFRLVSRAAEAGILGHVFWITFLV